MDLDKLDRESLIAKIRELEVQGLDISMKKIEKAIQKDNLSGAGELAYYRKKIRHLIRDTEESAEDKKRRAELNAFPLRRDTAKGQQGLREDIAAPLYQGGDANVKLLLNNYTSLSKGELISGIIKAEKYIRENGVPITAPVKKTVPKLSVKPIDDGDETVTPAIVASPRAGLGLVSPRPTLVKPSLGTSPRPAPVTSPRPALEKPGLGTSPRPTLVTSPRPTLGKPSLGTSPRPAPEKPGLGTSPKPVIPTLAASPRAIPAIVSSKPIPAIVSSKPTPLPSPRLTLKKLEEEEPAVLPPSSGRMKTPINAPLPKTESAGKYNYEDLLKKKVEELREILKKNKIQDADVKTSEQAADMIFQISKHRQGCSEEDFCEDGLICDMDSKPGICVDPGAASKKPAWFEYNGQQFVGSEKAIDNLKNMVGAQEYKTMPADSGLVAKAMKITGKPKQYFSKMNSAQLKLFIEGVEVEEKRRGGFRREIIERLSEVYESPVENFKGLSLSDLTNMLEKAGMEHATAARTLAGKTGEDPDAYESLSIPEIQRKIAQMEKPKPGKKKISLGEDDGEEEIKEVIVASPVASPLPSPRKRIMLGDDDDEEEEVRPMMKPPQPLLKPLIVAPEKKVEIRRAQESIGVKDVESIIEDVLVGKGEIDQFSDVQKAVVQCLGLLQA